MRNLDQSGEHAMQRAHGPHVHAIGIIRALTKEQTMRRSSQPGLRTITRRVNNLNETSMAAITVTTMPVTTICRPFELASYAECELPESAIAGENEIKGKEWSRWMALQRTRVTCHAWARGMRV